MRHKNQKIQNRHRPLLPEERSARFQRLRARDPSIIARGSTRGEMDSGYVLYGDEEEYDDGYAEYRRTASASTRRMYLVEMMMNPVNSLSPPENAREDTADAEADILEQCPAVSSDLIGRLALHVERIAICDFDRPSYSPLLNDLRAAIGNGRNLEIIKASVSSPIAEAFCFLAPFWLRKPLTWNPDSGILLHEHLFLRYTIPPFLKHLAEQPYQEGNYKWLYWLILLGQGGSLKAAADVFDWDIPSRFPHFLTHIPPTYSPLGACLLAEILRLGGSEIDAHRMFADDSFVIDITDMEIWDPEVRFWRETVAWIIAHREDMSDPECRLILQWARHQFTESVARRLQPFSWKGRRLQAVRENSFAYQQEREHYAYVPQRQWSPHGWDWKVEEEPFIGWSFTELTTSWQLFEEGQAMSHCVGDYSHRCAQNLSAVVSVRYEERRCVTVEIEPATGRIIQVHGKCNRQVDSQEQRVTNAWHTKVVLPDISRQSAEVRTGQ